MARVPSAFTRLEVAVSLCALVVIWALLMPAMRHGRGDARRAACAARLGGLAQMVAQFETAQQRYPGYLEAFGRDVEGFHKIGNWVVPLLPYAESVELYERWTSPATTGDWTRRGGGNSKLNDQFYIKQTWLLCPADTNSGEPMAPLSFAVNCGFSPGTVRLEYRPPDFRPPEYGPPEYGPLDNHARVLRATSGANGVFSNQLPSPLLCLLTQNQPTRILGSAVSRPTRSSDMVDGLSHTLCASENLEADSWAFVGRPAGWMVTNIAGEIYAGDDLTDQSVRVHSGLLWLYAAQPKVPGVPDYKPSAPSVESRHAGRQFSSQWARPRSNHSGIVNVAMLDGQVETLSTEIDYSVYQKLMAPDDLNSDIPRSR